MFKKFFLALLFFSLFFKPLLALATRYPLKIRDASGRAITLPKKPQRIISLMPNITEILFALGRGQALVGVSEFSNYPPQALSQPSIGGQILNIEKIVSLNPDLIIGQAKTHGEPLEKIKKLNYPVYLTASPATLDQIITSIINIGVLTDSQKDAQKLAAELQQKINQIKNDSLKFKPKAIIFVWARPFISAGKNTFLADLIKTAGGINLADKGLGPYPEISLEFLIQSAPEVIIIPAKLKERFLGEVRKNKIFNQIKIKNILILNDDWLSRPGPRIIRALEIIHQAFKNLKND